MGGIDVDENIWNEFLKDVDIDGDGRISQEEFVTLMLSKRFK